MDIIYISIVCQSSNTIFLFVMVCIQFLWILVVRIQIEVTSDNNPCCTSIVSSIARNYLGTIRLVCSSWDVSPKTNWILVTGNETSDHNRNPSIMDVRRTKESIEIVISNNHSYNIICNFIWVLVCRYSNKSRNQYEHMAMGNYYWNHSNAEETTLRCFSILQSISIYPVLGQYSIRNKTKICNNVIGCKLDTMELYNMKTSDDSIPE